MQVLISTRYGNKRKFKIIGEVSLDNIKVIT
jgi:hypothetical protein